MWISGGLGELSHSKRDKTWKIVLGMLCINMKPWISISSTMSFCVLPLQQQIQNFHANNSSKSILRSLGS